MLKQSLELDHVISGQEWIRQQTDISFSCWVDQADVLILTSSKQMTPKFPDQSRVSGDRLQQQTGMLDVIYLV